MRLSNRTMEIDARCYTRPYRKPEQRISHCYKNGVEDEKLLFIFCLFLWGKNGIPIWMLREFEILFFDCSWRHGGHVGGKNNVENSFGNLIILLCKTWETFCHCFVHQHGRLITWLKTKNCFGANMAVLSRECNQRILGVNVIKVLHLYFTRVAIVSLAENNSCTCKLQV